MSMGVQGAMEKKRDRIVTIGIMLVRLGFVVAAVLGLGMMTEIWGRSSVLSVHLLTGALVVVGLWVATLRLVSLGRGAGILWGAAVISLLGAGLGLAAMQGMGNGIVHLVAMLAAVGMGEAGVAKATRLKHP